MICRKSLLLNAALIFSLQSLASSAGDQRIRYQLYVEPDALERPGVQQLKQFIETELTRSGWTSGSGTDVRASIAWTFERGRWCAHLTTEWWDRAAQEKPGHCAATRPYPPEDPKPPRLDSLLALVAGPVVEELKEEGNARWTLRLSHRVAAMQPILLAGELDVTRYVQWVGESGILSMPAQRRAIVKADGCSKEATEATPEVDLTSLTAVRQLQPLWRIGTEGVSKIVTEQGKPFELFLKLVGGGPAGSGAVDVKCAGELTVSISESGLSATPRPHHGDEWNWQITTKQDEGSIVAQVRASSADESNVTGVQIGFQLPFISAAWKKIKGWLSAAVDAVKELDTLYKLLVGGGAVGALWAWLKGILKRRRKRRAEASAKIAAPEAQKPTESQPLGNEPSGARED